VQVQLENLAQLRPTMFLYTVSCVEAGSNDLQMGLEDRWRREARRWVYFRPGRTKHAFAFGEVQDMVLEMAVVSFGAQVGTWTRLPL
jgi:hypothetical protein